MAKSQEEKNKGMTKAVALRYLPNRDRAPRVTAKGSGLLAERIIELAKEHGIPIKEDKALVQILSELDFQEEIPPSVYVVVAEILAFVYALGHQLPRPEIEKE
jgi:flagellar biosynthesis protein